MNEAAAETVEPSIDLAFREAADADFNFVLATWIKSFQRGGFLESARRTLSESVPSAILCRAHHAAIERILCRGARVLLATPAHEPDVFCGYLVIERDGSALHWVYVKGAFRGLGIARELMGQIDASKVVQFTHRTADAPRILRYVPKAVFFPYS